MSVACYVVLTVMTNPLGKNIPYTSEFDESVLFPIERSISRTRLSIKEPLPFEGSDRWTAYELSWLNGAGVPQVAIASIKYPATSPFLVESKSLKLFLGGFNFKRYESPNEVASVIRETLSRCLKCDQVEVSLSLPGQWSESRIVPPPGVCVDGSPIESEHHFRFRALEITDCP